MERELAELSLPRWGRVVAGGELANWLVVDPAGEPVEPITAFLRDLEAQDASPATVRSYAFALLRWWRWLQVLELEWDRASSADVRELVLWLRQARKPVVAKRRASAMTAGTINPVTRKQYPGDGYAARTVRHSNAVLRAFYEY
jgi:integrase/recombinase XerD